jgi:hypothetical protein
MHFSCADGIAYGDSVIYANLDLEGKRWYDHPSSTLRAPARGEIGERALI